MINFEGYSRRIDKINSVLGEYGIESLEAAQQIVSDNGIDVRSIVLGIQPIAFENAVWAYTVGAAIAIKAGAKNAAEAAEYIGKGLQAFCIPGSVADQRKVGLGHGNLGAMLLNENTKCFAFLAGHESFAAAEGAIGIAKTANKVRKTPLKVILNGLGKDAAYIISRINGFTFVETNYDYYTGELHIVSEKAFSSGERSAVRCYGADDVNEGVAIMKFEDVDVSDISIIILEWTHGNNENLKNIDYPIYLHSTPELTYQRRVKRNSVACVQSDIKRVFAFSTISQIGFMMVALGVCTSLNPHEGGLGYMAGMFHLFTHAMFKALLFLGAGSIIHAVHSNEMSAMGGLRKYMPVTHITFLIACLAIAGIPPFSGFFSKDEILTACFRFSPVMGWIMTVIAAMTAFYMFRLYYGIFWSDKRSAANDEHSSHNAHHTPHESPLTMTVPLMFLALVTIVAGFIPFGHFVSSNGEAYTIHLDWGVAGTSIAIAVISIALATYMYKSGKQQVANALARRFNGLWAAAYHRFYLDEVYQFITHRIIFGCISRPIAWWDRHVVDGFFDFLAWGANATSDEIRGLQSGRIQQYTFVFLLGTLALILLLLL